MSEYFIVVYCFDLLCCKPLGVASSPDGRYINLAAAATTISTRFRPGLNTLQNEGLGYCGGRINQTASECSSVLTLTN